MSITKIHIKNLKSLKDVSLEISDITCFIGENGAGKSNIIKALLFFHKSLTKVIDGSDMFDKTNPFLDFFEINVTFDFSKIINIAINQNNKDPFNLHYFFRRILYDFESKLQENKLLLKLKYFKSGIKEWNHDQSTLSLVSYLFPIIHVPARHIKLTDWNIIWDTIGEMSNNPNIIKPHDTEEIIGLFDESHKIRLSKDVAYIKNEFKNNDIHIEPFSSKQVMSHILQLELGGRKFTYNEKDLDYFSDGINSNNFLKTLISIVHRIQYSKLYKPLIILDEPEIGLHPKLTDELIELYVEKSKDITILIATHSPRVVRNIIGTEKGNLFHISAYQNHTYVRKIKKFVKSRETNIVTENEASYYFSRGILFVEGATELELFTNKNIISLFPHLKKIDIFSFDSNNIKLNLIHPRESNTAIPYLVLLDMDKIISYNENSRKFSPSGDIIYNPLKNETSFRKEAFHFGKRRFTTLNTRERIESIFQKATFIANSDWKFIEDNLFETTKSLIRDYCLQYRVFPVETTIEGSIINKNNSDIFIQWFFGKYNSSKFIEITQNHSGPQLITLLRLIARGKFDTLNNPNREFRKKASADVTRILRDVDLLMVKKTEGWVSEFFDFYFKNILSKKTNKISTFKMHFPELHAIITDIEIMMREHK